MPTIEVVNNLRRGMARLSCTRASATVMLSSASSSQGQYRGTASSTSPPTPRSSTKTATDTTTSRKTTLEHKPTTSSNLNTTEPGTSSESQSRVHRQRTTDTLMLEMIREPMKMIQTSTAIASSGRGMQICRKDDRRTIRGR